MGLLGVFYRIPLQAVRRLVGDQLLGYSRQILDPRFNVWVISS